MKPLKEVACCPTLQKPDTVVATNTGSRGTLPQNRLVGGGEGDAGCRRKLLLVGTADHCALQKPGKLHESRTMKGGPFLFLSVGLLQHHQLTKPDTMPTGKEKPLNGFLSITPGQPMKGKYEVER